MNGFVKNIEGLTDIVATERFFIDPVLINRDPAHEFKLPTDDWYQVIPLGEHIHKPTGLIQVLDPTACEQIVNRFKEEAKRENFPGILVDYDHFSQDTDKPSEAAGWIIDLDNREDGVWAKIRWSDKGKEAVAGGRYRLVSPVWKRSDCDSLDNGRVRPRRLDSVALTNDPNLKGLVPLSNRSYLSGAEVDGELDPALELRALLGLPSDATDDEVKQALDENQHAPRTSRRKSGRAVRNRRNSDESMNTDVELTPEVVEEMLNNRESEFAQERDALQNRLDTLQASYDQLLSEQADATMREFASVITDAKSVKEMLLTNRGSTLKLLQGWKAKADKSTQRPNAGRQPLHNRDEAGLPADITDSNPGGNAAAKKVMNRAKEIMTTTRLSGRAVPFATAFNMAKGELAEA